MSEIPVTTVTRNADVDDLTDADYRDIYDEVRQLDSDTGNYAISLDKFVALAQSIYSKALWSKYHNGMVELNRTMRSELRSAWGWPRCRPPSPRPRRRTWTPTPKL